MSLSPHCLSHLPTHALTPLWLILACVPWPGFVPATFVYPDDTLTNWPTQPGALCLWYFVSVAQADKYNLFLLTCIYIFLRGQNNPISVHYNDLSKAIFFMDERVCYMTSNWKFLRENCPRQYVSQHQLEPSKCLYRKTSDRLMHVPKRERRASE